MVRFRSITNSPLIKVTVVMPGEKLTVSPDEALRIACRNEPGPLSFPFLTVMVAASMSLALNNSTAIAQAALIPFFVFISFLRSSLEILRQRRGWELQGLPLNVRLIQVVRFYKSNSRGVTYTANDRGVAAWWQGCNDRRLSGVRGSVAAAPDL